MKPISLAILCLFAMAPFLLMTDIRSDSLAKSLELRAYYDTAIDNAISDAAWTMAGSVRDGAGYGSAGGLQVEEEAAVSAFYETLAAGLGALGIPSAEARVRSHVPVLLTVGKESAVLRVQAAHLDRNGILVTELVRMPGKPYSWDPGDSRHLVRFTMGTDIQVYDRLDNTLQLDSWTRFAETLPGLRTEEGFASKRLETVTRVVQSLLEEGMALVMSGSSNIPATVDDVLAVTGPHAGVIVDLPGGGSRFRFDLPKTEDAAFRRAVSDVGMLAFVQGLPVGGDKTYDTFAFGGGRVIRRTQVAGYLWDERFLYCRTDCRLFLERSGQAGFDTDALRFYTAAEEAAAEGYEPCPVCRP